MAGLQINYLNSGGLITNYYCTSECGHCLYRCSPKWKKEYIDKPGAKAILQKILSLGCNSIHIGGGEPLLNECRFTRTQTGWVLWITLIEVGFINSSLK
jgi:2-iminoacetate synthase ThiH